MTTKLPRSLLWAYLQMYQSDSKKRRSLESSFYGGSNDIAVVGVKFFVGRSIRDLNVSNAAT